jgi:hypothetical protein
MTTNYFVKQNAGKIETILTSLGFAATPGPSPACFQSKANGATEPLSNDGIILPPVVLFLSILGGFRQISR